MVYALFVQDLAESMVADAKSLASAEWLSPSQSFALTFQLVKILADQVRAKICYRQPSLVLILPLPIMSLLI